jgi:predicted subunit of tRNA(5-methylaminomethyl-2-thiouridylate) methyltransferase
MIEEKNASPFKRFHNSSPYDDVTHGLSDKRKSKLDMRLDKPYIHPILGLKERRVQVIIYQKILFRPKEE